MQWKKDNFTITCDSSKLDIDVIYEFISQSYWSKGIPRATLEKSVNASLCFALLENKKQIGFARVISDFATIAYLGDVFILEQFRGQGLSKWLLECVNSHPDLQGLRRWILATADAHGLYQRYGFTPLKNPTMFMERHNPNIYQLNN